MARKKQETARQKYDKFLATHPKAALAIILASAYLTLVGLFVFIVFSGFGASSDFIYNQF